MSITRLTNDIAAIDREITELITSRGEIERVRTRRQNRRRSWRTAHDTLNNDSTLTDVKRVDVFEGEMANSMASRVADLLSDIKRSFGREEPIGRALQRQITRINNRISSLQSTRSSLNSTLNTMIENRQATQGVVR